MRLDDATAVIFGGASGLGAATARRLARDGARPVIADIDAEHGAAVAGELGGEFVACDVRSEDDVLSALEVAGGAVRVAVCCAGRGSRSKTASSRGPHPLDEFREVVELNLIGTANVLRLAAHRMLANEPQADGERGVIVTTASVAAFEGQRGQLAYAASKAGIVGMTLPAARDLADKGIRVLTIAPGVFDTPLLGKLPAATKEALASQIPFPGRLGEPAEFADLVAAIVGTPMLNGTTIRLDGALRMPPG